MNKKNKILLFTIAFLVAISTSSYKTSVSKYIVDKEVDIRYGITYQKMTTTSLLPDSSGFGIDHNQSTTDTIVYKFQYYRSTNMTNDDDYNTYRLTTPSECTLESIASNIPNIPYDKGKKIIVFPDLPILSNGRPTDLIKYTVSCPLSSVIDGEYIKMDFVIYESFNDESKEYQYTDLHYQSLLSSYYENHPLTADYFDSTTNTIYLEKEYTGSTQGATIYSRFSEQLKSFTTDLSSINYYLLGYNLNSTSTLSDINQIDGLSVDESSDDKYNLIKIDNYFTSYANTYQNQNLNQYYFPTNLSNKTDVNNLFYYYLQKYRYPDYNVNDSNDKKEYDAIKIYLDNLIADSNIIEVSKNNRIAAIRYNADNNYLKVSDTLYNCATIDSVNNIEMTITKTSVTKDTIRRTIAQSLMENSISTSMARVIASSEEIYNAYIDLANNNIIEDYIYITDDTDSIILHTIPTTMEEAEIYVEAYILKSGNNIKLSYASTDTTSPFEDMTKIYTEYYKGTESLSLEDGTLEETTNFTNLIDGEYNTNIGYLVISTNGANKIIQIHLK